METNTTLSKKCALCGNIKPLDLFTKRRNVPTGRSPRCKACQKTSRAPNADLARARSKAYASLNPNTVSAAKKRWYEGKRDEIHAQHKKRYQEDVVFAEVARARARKSRDSNPEACKMRDAAYGKRIKLELTKHYVIRILIQNSPGLKREDVPTELIDQVRMRITLKRAIKAFDAAINTKGEK